MAGLVPAVFGADRPAVAWIAGERIGVFGFGNSAIVHRRVFDGYADSHAAVMRASDRFGVASRASVWSVQAGRGCVWSRWVWRRQFNHRSRKRGRWFSGVESLAAECYGVIRSDMARSGDVAFV